MRFEPANRLDFWRVEAVEQDRLLLLRAEMKVPGKAWLQFEINSAGGWQHTFHRNGLFCAARLLGIRLLVCHVAVPCVFI